MKILGIGGLIHDPAVAVLEGLDIAFALESEKITRHKDEISFLPEDAIQMALRYVGDELRNFDHIATNWSGGPISNRFYIPLIARFLQTRCFPWSLIPLLVTISVSHRPTYFVRLQADVTPPITPVPHHLAHLGAAYTLSPFEEAAVVIVDGSGEVACTSVYHCHDRAVKKIYSMDLPLDSLGHLYTTVTSHLGFRVLGDEYKVMGLAAYGESRPEYDRFFRQAITLHSDGRYRMDRKLVGNYFTNSYRFPAAVHQCIGRPRRRQEAIEQRHKDLARSLQRRLEETLLHVLRHVRVSVGSTRLCLAGGVALNCVANGRIVAEAGFSDVFIPPAPHDAGTALGAATYLQYHVLQGDRPTPLSSPYLGPRYSRDDVEDALVEAGLQYVATDKPARVAAQLLASGHIVGWFQGRTEFGPRALGNRSILADPRTTRNAERINRSIKKRELFRPLAPAILEEAMPRYFENLAKSPYMLLASEVRPERRKEIAGVVHVDGTARPQSVSRVGNPRFYELIEAFGSLTGVPVVLNTSFNIAGEPMVSSPSDALRCFFSSGLDALVIEDFILTKPGVAAR